MCARRRPCFAAGKRALPGANCRTSHFGTHACTSIFCDFAPFSSDLLAILAAVVVIVVAVVINGGGMGGHRSQLLAVAMVCKTV